MTSMERVKRNIELCKAIQAGDKGAEAEVIELNDDLVLRLVSSVDREYKLNCRYDFEDACQDCRIAILNAAKHFNYQEKKYFRRYAAICTWRILRHQLYKRYALRVPAKFDLYKLRGQLDEYILSTVEEADNAVLLSDVAQSVDTEDIVLYEELVEDDDFSYDMYSWTEFGADLVNILRRRSVTEQRMLVMYYGCDGLGHRSCECIGQLVGMSRDQVFCSMTGIVRRLYRDYSRQMIRLDRVPEVGTSEKFRHACIKIARNSCIDCMHYSKEKRVCTLSQEVRDEDKQKHCRDWSICWDRSNT